MMLALWEPTLGLSPATLHGHVLAFGVHPDDACGSCLDCMEPTPAAPPGGGVTSASVLGLELLPSNAALLAGISAYAALPPGKLTVLPFGAGSAPGVARVFTGGPPGDEQTSLVLHPRALPLAGDQFANVSIVTLDGLDAAGLLRPAGGRALASSTSPMIDILFIDVEGLDPAVLEGAAGLIATGRVRAIVVECCTGTWLEPERTLSVVSERLDREAGFDCILLGSRTGVAVTGGCFVEEMTRTIHNVVCVRREEAAWHAALMAQAVWLPRGLTVAPPPDPGEAANRACLRWTEGAPEPLTAGVRLVNLTCPVGTVVAAVQTALWGDVAGGCGAGDNPLAAVAAADAACPSVDVSKYVSSACLGVERCPLLATALALDEPCYGRSKTLAVVAACAAPASARS